jgi:hypothetical protein
MDADLLQTGIAVPKKAKLSTRKQLDLISGQSRIDQRKNKAKERDERINKQLKEKLDEIHKARKKKADQVKSKCTSCTQKKPLPYSMRNIDNV